MLVFFFNVMSYLFRDEQRYSQEFRRLSTIGNIKMASERDNYKDTYITDREVNLLYTFI